MPPTPGSTTSVWMSTANLPSFPPLTADLQADVCIVGAGIAGISVAYHLTKAGKKVVVLDDGPVGGGETGRTTAHLSNAFDDRYHAGERMHGERGAHLVADSHTVAVNTIEHNVKLEGIECGFERLDGYLFSGDDTKNRDEQRQGLAEELAAVHRAGIADARLIDRAPVSFDTGPCILFPQQAQFHPLQYLAGLVRAIEAGGGIVHCGSHVEEIKDGVPCSVKTKGGHTVTCRAIVVATNTPVNDWVKIHTKQSAYRTYVIGAKVPRESIPRVLLWDDLDPYHYVRLAGASLDDPASDILLVGGEDQKTGQYDDANQHACFDALEQWAREHFPVVTEIAYRWSGQVMEPVDGLAFIGRNPGGPDNVYVATGDSGHGMTHGTIAGMILSDLVRGIDHPWAALYDPSRKPSHALGEYAKETLETVSHYAQYVLPADVDDADDVGRNQGAIVREGLALHAVSCNEQGVVRKCSAVCPHLGGIVAWNAAEKSFDCPMHGSRFDREGTVVNGPANSNLKQVDELAPEAVLFDESLKLA